MIKQYFLLAFIIIILLVLQTSFLPGLNSRLIWPNFVLLFILSFFLILRDDESPQKMQAGDLFWLLLLAGFLTDLLSTSVFGIFTVGFLLMGLIVYIFNHGIIDPGINFKSVLLVALLVAWLWPALYHFINGIDFSPEALLLSLLITLVSLPLSLLTAGRISHV